MASPFSPSNTAASSELDLANNFVLQDLTQFQPTDGGYYSAQLQHGEDNMQHVASVDQLGFSEESLGTPSFILSSGPGTSAGTSFSQYAHPRGDIPRAFAGFPSDGPTTQAMVRVPGVRRHMFQHQAGVKFSTRTLPEVSPQAEASTSPCHQLIQSPHHGAPQPAGQQFDTEPSSTMSVFRADMTPLAIDNPSYTVYPKRSPRKRKRDFDSPTLENDACDGLVNTGAEVHWQDGETPKAKKRKYAKARRERETDMRARLGSKLPDRLKSERKTLGAGNVVEGALQYIEELEARVRHLDAELERERAHRRIRESRLLRTAYETTSVKSRKQKRRQNGNEGSGILATLKTDLRSVFTGGAVNLTQSGLFHAYDMAPLSELCTAVLGSYVGIHQDVEPPGLPA
ncbi:hypothetical protein DENSPDRAFT_851831 [Dentipellis sp. KUC8613]|nr:hypothetical protein DENSPDRAFT_851831 [Dentipellis sp. KUC8613]